MAPTSAVDWIPFGNIHDDATNLYARQAELASICRKHNVQRRKAAEAAAKYEKAQLKEGKVQQRDALIAAKMPQLSKSFREASATKLQEHLAECLHRDRLDWGARGMVLAHSIFKPETCAICQDDMARPLALPCGGRHQFCEWCVMKWLGDSGGFGCPTCREDCGEWYTARKRRVCRKEVGAFVSKVKGLIREAEREVGIGRKWWRRGVRGEEVDKVIGAYGLWRR